MLDLHRGLFCFPIFLGLVQVGTLTWRFEHGTLKIALERETDYARFKKGNRRVRTHA